MKNLSLGLPGMDGLWAPWKGGVVSEEQGQRLNTEFTGW